MTGSILKEGEISTTLDKIRGQELIIFVNVMKTSFTACILKYG